MPTGPAPTGITQSMGWTSSRPAWGNTPAENAASSNQTNGLLQGSHPLGPAVNGNSRNLEGLGGEASAFDSISTFRALGHHPRASDESTQYQASLQSWNDGGSVHSPTDDRRRSFANSEYYNPFGSGVSSRNPSQPPSRSGNPPSTYFPSLRDQHPAVRASVRGHNPSISTASNTSYADRQNSIHSEGQPGLPTAPGLIRNQSTGFDELFEQLSLHASENPYFAQASSSNLSGQVNGIPSQPNGIFTAESVTPSFNDPFAPRTVQRTSYTPTTNELRRPPNHYNTNGLASAPEPAFNSVPQGGNADPTQLRNSLAALAQAQRQNIHQANQFHQSLNNSGYVTPQLMQQLLYANVPGLNLNALPLPAHPNVFNSAGNFQSLHNGYHGNRNHNQNNNNNTHVGGSVVSPLLEEFKNTHKAARHAEDTPKWHLKMIAGHVAEFCGDQNGSRFVQNQLETANSDEKEMVFKEIMPDVIQLMHDVFGNYVVQKFFENGDQRQKAEIASKMRGKIMDLSKGMYSCRVVQKALHYVLSRQQVELIREIGTPANVLTLAKDMNGNHVVQKAIEAVQTDDIQFIVDAFKGKCGELSKHTYGCRVIQRVLEKCPDAIKRTVITELHKVDGLIPDQFGNYVAQHIITFGSQDDQEKCIDKVAKNIVEYSCHKFASNVVERCFDPDFVTPDIIHRLFRTVLDESGPWGDPLAKMSRDPYGNYAVRKFILPLTLPFALLLRLLLDEILTYSAQKRCSDPSTTKTTSSSSTAWNPSSQQQRAPTT